MIRIHFVNSLHDFAFPQVHHKLLLGALSYVCGQKLHKNECTVYCNILMLS